MLYRKKLYIIIYSVTFIAAFQSLVAIWGNFNDLIWGQVPLIIYWPPVAANIQCYSNDTGDALKSVEDPSFSPKPKSIFFHETSCRGGINSRQACAVESAARAHPEWDVYLLFTAPVTKFMLEKSCLLKLLQFPNIRLARIHANSFSNNTIVHPIVRKSLRKSLQPVQHAADIMKMLTLHKWGGISIDLDMLVVKTLTNLPDNWIAKESPYRVASGVMRFSRDNIGRNFTGKVLREMSLTFDTSSWSFGAASAIERVLMRKCKRAIKNTGKCRGITIFGHKKFYPIPLSRANSVLNRKGPYPLKENKQKSSKYSYCLWNVFTGLLKVHEESAYVKMAKEVCPTIYQAFGCKFGV